ncbi:MAG: hypothetical protein HGA65_10125 [Oscillochloris sp.]|nr:hypothetical protein [Oscillochloris sp.]
MQYRRATCEDVPLPVRKSSNAQPQPPQIIYVQTVPQETTTSAGGCLPLIVLLAVILLAIGVV